ncbi:MFS transporter [Deinococcus metallilatus]|uniref:MFS family permease n=1 Tax=Deinococcus metallilatus TaxID=1211322 RepID=A0AAJ5F3Y7_9DEIO|nr:MFS transporter [Deinococcus metallilatus]MBB5297383.1 MFS family permease [Deinococcus metallilatus]QBY08799.1 MFS transporter [Deinococcus metallilatus]RXJ10680.1 MFS transporter [Deinococcus metallilatus]TLK26650.1 MFS transporter [Deinococcus metallilatus]GMA17032.1 MFS transporter [Deinococcus metallilatus]
MTVPTSPLRPVPWLTRVTLLLTATLTIMSGATIAPSLPAMQAHFAGLPNADVLVRLTVTVVGLAIAVSAPLSGYLTDRIGRRPVLVVAMLLYALAGSSGLYAPTLGSLMLGRVLLGLAVGATMTAGSALVADLFAGQERARFLGLQSAFTSLGGVIFLPLGGLLAGIGWRLPFAVYLAALLLVPLALRLPRGETAGERLAEAAVERVPWRPVLLAYAVALAYMLVFYLMPTQLPYRLEGLGVAPALVGFVMGVSTLSGALAALWFSRRGGTRTPVLTAGFSLVALAVGWTVVSLAPGAGWVVPGLIIGGAGAGLVTPNLNTFLAALAPAHARGRVMSGLSASIFLGQFLSPLLARPFVHGADVSQTFAAAAVFAVLVGAGLLVLGWRLTTQRAAAAD